MSDFWAMGGYAAFVWPAYTVFFAMLLIDAFTPLFRRRRVRRELRRRMQRQAARRRS